MKIYKELSKLFEQAFKLNKIKEGEKVLIATTSVFNKKHVEAYTTALNRLGAEVIRVTVPMKSIKEQKASPWLLDIYKSADMILDHRPCESYLEWNTPSPIPLYCEEFDSILKSGVRMLDLMLPENLLRRLFPTSDLIRRTRAGAEKMERAEMIHVKSAAGTDLTLSKKGRPGGCEIGVADIPGRWDNFGFGCVNCAPLEDSANGTLVLDPPSLMSSIGFVNEPVKCTLEDGYITKIEGGSTATLLRKWLAQWDDPESYGTSHIGWGTHLKALPLPGFGASPRDLLAHFHNAYGSMLIAFGANNMAHTAKYSGMDGKRVASSHIDIGVFNIDFYLDDELICSKGKIVDPQCK